MLLDANVLLYATNASDPRHTAITPWLESALSGSTRVGLPWQSIGAFLRIATNPRAMAAALTAEQAAQQVEDWLAAPAAWIPQPTERHADVLLGLVRKYRLAGPIVSDAQLAALAIEHGIAVCSTDGDFARFSEVAWRNPLAD